jgi:RHS repeat-associated protein
LTPLSELVTINYVYDPLHRLTEANYSNGDYYHYAYDPVGNRLTQDHMLNGQSSVVNYTYDNANRLASAGGLTYTFDNNGNLLSDGVNTYTYDSANRLISINGTSFFSYNGLGDRLSQTVNGQTTTYTLDLNAGLTQVLDDGTNAYVYGVGRIAQVNAGTEYFLGDALGSVRQIVDANTEITLSKAYDPYGNVTYSAGSGTSPFAFTGEQMDASGLTYLRARYYSSSDGRFLTRDTWSGDYNRPLSLNRWMYVEGNPVNRVDPTGRFSSDVIFKNISHWEFDHNPAHPSWLTKSNRERWGFFMMLRNAEDGSFFQLGSLKLDQFQLKPFMNYGKPHVITAINCDNLFVDFRQPLRDFYETEVKKQRGISIWWRDTSATHYKLTPGFSSSYSTEGYYEKIFVDGTYTSDLPGYRSISLAFPIQGTTLEGNIIVDKTGNFHLSIAGGGGATLGVGYAETYNCNTFGGCNNYYPLKPSDITQAIDGICLQGNAILITGINIAPICWGFGLNAESFTSSVTLYSGIQGGIGGGGSVTLPLWWIVPTQPSLSWKWAEDERLNGFLLGRNVRFFD